MSARGTGGDDPVDVDAAWAEIVARWEDPSGSRPAPERAVGADGQDGGPQQAGSHGKAGEGDHEQGRRDESRQEQGRQGEGRQDGAPGPTAPEASGEGGTGAGTPGRPAPDPPADRPSPRPPTDRPPTDRPPTDRPTAGHPPTERGADAPGWPDDAVARNASSRDPAEGHEDTGRADDDEHYVPAPPAPAPPVSGLVRAAWAGALGGPAVLLVCALVWRDAPTVVVVAAVVAFVAGFGVLVSRLPRSREDGDDDGAVV